MNTEKNMKMLNQFLFSLTASLLISISLVYNDRITNLKEFIGAVVLLTPMCLASTYLVKKEA